MNRRLILLLVTFTIIFPLFASELSKSNRIHIVLLNPADRHHWFWSMISDSMQAAADDLNIELEILYNQPERNHVLTIQQAQEVVNRTNPPDYLVIGNEKGVAGRIIEIAQKADIKVFLFNNGFVSERDIQKYGDPRINYSAWIGQITPNNFSAGYQIGKVLIQQGIKKGLFASDGRLHIAALAGAYNTHASTERVRGLEAVVNEYVERVTLVQVVPGDWTEATARGKSRLLFNRYQQVGAIWAANDVTAFGAMASARAIDKVPGKDILFGGCGWLFPAIEQVNLGFMSTTVGGHFLDGAWALVMLYDYHNGRDFIDDPYQPDMYSIDQTNVAQYLNVFDNQEWHRINFSQFSKTINPHIEAYDFSLEAVLAQFE